MRRKEKERARLTDEDRKMERLLGQVEMVRADLKETIQDMKEFIAQRSK